MGDVSSGQHKRKSEDRSSKMTKRKWTQKEDVALIAALSELCNAGWKRENRIFKNGYTAALERKLKTRLPGCNIKASPRIESRLKLLKRQYDAITEMQGVAGMQWDDKEHVLTCEDDDVWEEWVRTHTDAKGLRNMQFPYYNDLQLLFGNRGTRKGINNEMDVDKLLYDEDNNATTNLMVDDSFEEDDRGNHDTFKNGSYGRESSIERYKKRKIQRDVIRNPDHEEANDWSEDSARTVRSNDENLLTDALIRTETQPYPSNIKMLNPKKSYNTDCGSSKTRELAKIFGSFLEKYQEHLSLLSEIIGRESTAKKIAAEKRARLNGELTKLPNLTLKANP